MNPLYEVLLSWATLLSGYATPGEPPEVMVVSHAYLEQVACEGRPCKVMGWFPPGRTIFLDDRLDAEDDLYASSVVVHEWCITCSGNQANIRRRTLVRTPLGW